MNRPWRTLVDVPTLARALAVAPGRAPGRGAFREDILLLDVRHDFDDPEAGPRAFARSHLPGALHAHLDRDLSGPITPATGRHPLPDADAFVAACSTWGIDERVQVVAYDDKGGAWASRVWWLLKDYGHDAVAVLDGGLQAWDTAGFASIPEIVERAPRAFKGRPGRMPAVTAWDLTTRAPRCLVDARSPERYRGEKEPIDPVAGHIPHAINLPFAGNLDKDGRFLPPEELRAKFDRALAGKSPRDAAFYCGSGVTAPHDILAMHVAGLPGAALYPGSWSQWIRDPGRPVAKGTDELR